LALVGLAAAVVAVIFIMITTRSPKRPVQMAENPFSTDDRPIAIEWHSPGRATELPPIIEEARGRLQDAKFTGPQHPSIKWSITLPVTASLRIAGIVKDGTVYTTGMLGHIAAIRDGKLLWAYKAGTFGVSSVQIDDDGRLWFQSLDSVYCLNRDGKGGRLPSGFEPPRPRRLDSFSCVMNHSVSGPGWKMELDGECTTDSVAVAAGGPIYVGTDIPQILAVSTSGKVQWTYTPPCNPTRIVPTLPGRIVFVCKDRTLHGLSGASEQWQRTADGVADRAMLVDRAGTVYYSDYGRDTGINHVHAVDPNGKMRWTVDFHRTSISTLSAGNNGEIYVTASGPYGRLICLSD
jgi:outer membrane protein assembly factor BamB